MACCGKSIDKPQNQEELIRKLRKIDNTLDVKLKLNQCKMNFSAKKGKWITNFNELPDADVQCKEELLMKKDTEIEGLEKNYLAKIAKLLILTQLHCETKMFINDEFDRLGVTKELKFQEKIEEFNKIPNEYRENNKVYTNDEFNVDDDGIKNINTNINIINDNNKSVDPNYQSVALEGSKMDNKNLVPA